MYRRPRSKPPVRNAFHGVNPGNEEQGGMPSSSKRQGTAVMLNGAPRSGKSSIASAIQQIADEPWMNLGADRFIETTPAKFRPGIGLRPAGIANRPGGERPDLEPLIPTMYAALYESIAVHLRKGLNVVADVAHHDDYATLGGILYDCAKRLNGLEAYFVGVRCPVDVVWRRRRETWLKEEDIPADAPVPDLVRIWNREVHNPGIYDLEVDTSEQGSQACARLILDHMERSPGPDAFRRLAAMSG